MSCLSLFTEGQDPVRFPPSMLSRQLVQSLCRSCLGNRIVEMSWVQLPCSIKDALGGGHVYYTQCCSKHPSHLMLTGFLSPSSVVLLTCMLNHRYRDHFVTSSVLARHPGSSVVLCILTSCFCDHLHLLQKESGNYI